MFSLGLFAQQPAQYSLYMLNPYHYNPAYAGLGESLEINGVIRQQWVNLENSPSSQHINLHLPFYLLGGGLGLQFENDNLGVENNLRVNLAYSFHQELGPGLLSFGFSGGLLQRRVDGSNLITPDGSYRDGIINHNDNLLPLTEVSGQTFSFHAGAYYKSETLEFGFAVRDLTEPSIELDNFSLLERRHFNASAAAHFDLSSNLTLSPYALVRSDTRQTQTDAAILLQLNDNILGGASFRGYNSNSIDAISAIFGFGIGANLRLTYAYDITLSNVQRVSNGSHELMVSYRMGKPVFPGRPPAIIFNPRTKE